MPGAARRSKRFAAGTILFEENDPGNRMYGTLDAYRAQWPIRHVAAGMPPFLFLIAESEQEQPPVLMTNRKFVQDARAFGNRAEYKVLAGKTHYSAVRQIGDPGDPVFEAIRSFIALRQ